MVDFSLPATVDAIVAGLPAAWDVYAVYLYGSHAEGRARPDSDVDVAVVVGNPQDVQVLHTAEAQAELMSVLKHEVDLVVLNRVSPVLVRQVLSKGRRLRVLNPTGTADFEARALSMYLDLKRSRQPAERALQERYRGD